jgi:hypothetical protein
MLVRAPRLAMLGLVALVTAASAPFKAPVTPGPSAMAVAPALMDCNKCEDEGGQHSFTGSGAMMDCEAFNACHSNWQTGNCGQWHYGCGETETADLAVVAQSDDPESVQAYLREHKGYVYYNSERSVLQSIGCGGAITAQFPIRQTVAAALD